MTDSPAGGATLSMELPAGLDAVAALVALADEASAILEAYSPEAISTRERAAWERRRAVVLAALATQRPEFAPAADLAAADHRQAELADLGAVLAGHDRGVLPDPGPDLARRTRRRPASTDPV